MKKIIIISVLLLAASTGFSKELKQGDRTILPSIGSQQDKANRGPANLGHRQQIINCNGDETCIGLVLLSAIEQRNNNGGGYYNRNKTRLYGTASCNEQYFFGIPGSKDCPALLQAHGDANVWSYKQNGNCVSLSSKLSLSRACLIHGPSN